MKTITLLLVVLSWPILAHSQEPEKQKFSKESEATAQRLRETIGEEIKTLGKHPWAGEYYKGDGLGMNVHLSIAPKAGYVYEWHGCMGLYDRNYGDVVENDGKLRLSFKFERAHDGPIGIAEVLRPIAWGERHYLVSAREMIGFCNAINDGSEPRDNLHGFVLLRSGDEKCHVSGFPAVPKAFEPYLLSKPIETEIVSVEKPITTSYGSNAEVVTIRVTLKHGTKSGLLPGMKLHVTKPDNIHETVDVDKVSVEQSNAVVTYYHDKAKVAVALPSIPDKNPENGWKLSTRPSWRTEREPIDQRTAVKKRT